MNQEDFFRQLHEIGFVDNTNTGITDPSTKFCYHRIPRGVSFYWEGMEEGGYRFYYSESTKTIEDLRSMTEPMKTMDTESIAELIVLYG